VLCGDRRPSGCGRLAEASGQARRQYVAEHHTHFHISASGEHGSSRLDRIYVGASATKYVRGMDTEEPLCKTDHRAVLLKLHSPKGPLRINKTTKDLPASCLGAGCNFQPNSAATSGTSRDSELHSSGRNHRTVARFKTELKLHLRALAKEARVRMTNGYNPKSRG
jgi:hypothetical protein